MNKTEGENYENIPLYNIRIIRSYIDYLHKHYPHISIDKLLAHAGISKFQYNDDGYWCNQRQANRFQEILINQTGNKNIASDAGRNLVNSQSVISLYILGFLDPVNISRQIARIYKTLSRAAIIEITNLENNRFEMISSPAHGVKEELYQCKNRVGGLEGLLKYFLHEYPTIEHPECLHHGANYCRYIVSWDKPNKISQWIKIRNYSLLIGVLLSVTSYVFIPIQYALFTVSISLAVIIYLFHYAFHLEKDKFQKDFSEVSQTAEDYWNELNIRYSSVKLVQEVGEITSFIQSEREISSAVSDVMSKRLDYERGAILLAQSDKKSLFCAGGYGFTDDEIEVIINAQFRIDNADKIGILQKVFVQQEPAFIEDINKISSTLNTDNLNIVQKLKIQSIICVPIVHEGESIGVMAVDSLKTKLESKESDINLLMAVAAQTALSIAHARAFRKLQESEKKHRTLVETVRDIVYTVDLEGRFSYISPMIECIAGYNDKELLGRKFIEIVAPPYKEPVMQRFIDGIEAGGTSTYEIEIIAKDNKIVPLEVNVTSLTDNKSQVIGRIGVARDITRRKQEEAERKELEVKVLTQDKLASLGEIATGVAHEINQPLSYIKIILESTLNDIEIDKVDKLELSEDFNESLRQIGKISNIISHLRTFGRSDVTSLSAVDLSNVLDDTLILMNERLRIKNISLDLKINENLPMLYGNQVKLEQVFINLIQNSMDAIEEQGKGNIMLSAQEQDDHVVILYSDTGEGIAPQMQEKIFDPFFTTKEPGKGTGIGLSIVYGIIQEHNGAISCESEEGKGATFRIKLPLYLEESVDLISPLLHA